MLLSEFLKLNGGLELKKRARIKSQTWEDLLKNVYPPTRTICENIISYLGGDSDERKKYYSDVLWECILEIDKPTRVLDITVHVEPCAAPRPRFTRFGRVYNPSKYTSWKKNLSNIIGNIGVISGPCWISAEYHFKCTNQSKLGYHTSVKDIDNLDKSVLDALQMNGLLLDDKIVYRMDSIKYFSFQNMIKLKIHHSGLWK